MTGEPGQLPTALDRPRLFEIAPGERVLGIEIHGLRQVFDCGVRLAHGEQHHAKVVVDLWIFRIEFGSPGQSAPGFSSVLLPHGDLPENVVRLRELRVGA